MTAKSFFSIKRYFLVFETRYLTALPYFLLSNMAATSTKNNILTAQSPKDCLSSHLSDSNQEKQDQQPLILSKKAEKKLLKAERFAASKVERRARQKIIKKEKQKERRIRSEAEDGNNIQPPCKRQRLLQPFGARVVVDLGFDDKMSDKVCYIVMFMHFIDIKFYSGDRLVVFSTRLHI